MFVSDRKDEAGGMDAIRAVINSLPQAVALVTPDGMILAANAGAGRLGLAAGQGIKGHPAGWLAPLVGEVLVTGAGAGMRGVREAPRDAFVQIVEEGRDLLFLPQAHPVVDAAGAIAGVTVVLLEVTDEKRVDDMRQGILSSLSHKLKTPMTSIQMSIHLLLEDAVDRLTSRQMELLRAAGEDADRLQAQIEELLTRARQKR